MPIRRIHAARAAPSGELPQFAQIDLAPVGTAVAVWQGVHVLP